MSIKCYSAFMTNENGEVPKVHESQPPAPGRRPAKQVSRRPTNLWC